MAFQTATRAVTDVEAVVFTPVAESALMVRNTGGQTATVGPAAAATFPVESGDLILFAGIVVGDVLSAKCAAGLSTTLELIWTTGP